MKFGQWLVAAGVLGWITCWGAFNYHAGSIYADEAVIADVSQSESAAAPPAPDTERFFTMKIAPLLAKHCLECHDAAVRERDLDLSRQATAEEGGRGGPAIVPGEPEESLLWDYVHHGDMPPPERPALEDEEKQLLRQWIEAGAVWSGDRIDMAALTRDSRAVYHWLQRLTVPEYIETVRRTLGVDIEREARDLLPAEVRADGFTNTAYNLAVDLAHIEAYAELAYRIVQRMDIEAFVAEHVDTDCRDLSDACMRTIIADVGRWVLRGPLDEEEIDAFADLADAVEQQGGDFEEAVSYVLEAMLQSPRFIYRFEQTGDGTPRKLDSYELASRMSYIIWGGPPDEKLMRAAAAGDLADLDQVRVQVERMLQDPRAIEQSQRFVAEWLYVDHVSNLAPDAHRFPQWNADLARDIQAETLAFVEEVLWEQQRPMWDLMNAQVTFATPRLAEHYDLDADLADAAPHYVALETEAPDRVADGLQVLYHFDEGADGNIEDVSGTGEPADLRAGVTDPITGSSGDTWHWADDGLAIEEPTTLTTASSPIDLIDNLRDANAITLEAWVTPANTSQDGPARILTFSRDTSNRNFTLGQDGDRFNVRLRTSETNDNGMPGLSSEPGTVATEPVHVVYTRDASGEAVIYVNGREAGRERIEGDFSNWDGGYELAVGNELSDGRPWLGTLHLAAVYDRALTPEQVQRNHLAGARGEGVSPLEALYHFDEGDGATVRDASPHTDEPLDLTINDTAGIEWREGGLWLDGTAKLLTAEPATRLTQAVRDTGELTIEAWVTPDNAEQDGPARIVSLSDGTQQRNFTLGQEGDRYDGRLRTTRRGDNNGLPSLTSEAGAADRRPTHLVYTRTLSGTGRIYVDGEEHDGDFRDGSLANWDDAFHLILGNETSGDRGWRGTLHAVAIYSRALTEQQVRAKGQVLARYDLADVPERGGLLTQASVLTRGGDNASMVSRGLFVLHDLLHSAVGSAPPCVDTTPVPTEPGLSQRAIAEARLADGNCNACHARFEPLAFGLEKYNGIGAYFQVDQHGNELRDDGEILFPGESEPIAYDNAAEMMELLADSDRVRMNFTRKLTQFAIGRPLIEADEPILDDIHHAAVRSGGDYQSLIRAIVTSDLVRKIPLESHQ